MDLSGRWFRVGGLLVAGIGFAITRLFVVEAVQADTTLSFLFAGILPLSLGLGLVAYGIGLAVGSFSREYVLTVAQWCLLGTGASVSILLVTSFNSMMEPGSFQVLSGSPLLAANVLLGGSIGGVLVGNRSATTHRQQRQIQRQANRALLLDRLLRHEVINAVNIIRGNATLLANGENAGGGIDTIENASERITSTIEEVGTLIEENDTAASVDVAAILATETASLDEAFPEVDATYEGPTEGLDAAVDERIEIVFRELLENAAEDEDTTRIEAGVASTNHEVRITVSDDGSGLPDQQRDLLVSGAFPEYDDPSSGFGLQIVRLLVLAYGGQLTVEDGIDGAGTTVAVTLPRIDVDRDIVRSVGVSMRNLYWAILTGLFAGVAMGVFFVVATDVLPVIGALYGVQSPLIGMVTHLFHSVIFALIYAGACARPSLSGWLSRPLRGGVAGIVWGTMLWLVAAGVIMPLLLRGVGLMAALPNLPAVGFVSHAIWGGVLGVSYAFVQDRPVPWLE
jgi:two-component system OmpR family sensor kinase